MRRRILLFFIMLASISRIYAQASLSIENFKIKPGETREILLNLTNTVPIRALQVQIVFPECLSLAARPVIVAERQGHYVDEFGQTVSSNKTINYNKQIDGSYIVTVNADDGVPFSGTEGAIISLKVKANETAIWGESTLLLQNAELVFQDGETHIRPQDVKSSVTIYQMFEITAEATAGGSVVGAGVYESGSLVTLTAVPQTSYRFVKWSDGTTENPYTFSLIDDKVITAFFEIIPSYYIIYVVDGVEYKRVSVLQGSKVAAEEEPSKEGHSFTGWSGLPDTMPANNVTVTGRFVANSYEITYILNGEEFRTEYVKYGEEIITPEVPAVEGYSFGGWSELPETMPAKDITVIGEYMINRYRLSYVVDGDVYYTDSVAYGTALTAIDVPVKEGYTFSGWIGLPETMPAKDVTINGTFIINKYLVTFKIGDDVVASDSLEYGAAIVAPEAPEKEGHTFSGWGDVAETVPAGDLTYEGSYSVNSYLLTYMVDGETVQTDSVVYGTAITALAEPTKEGYTFSGWVGLPKTMPAKDVIVTGSFVTNGYTLTYLVDGEVYHTIVCEYGTSLTAIDVPVKEGYTFSGWIGLPETMPAKDVTINGTFIINKYLVTFKIGDDVVASDSLEYGAAIVAPEAPEKEGHTFSGWGDVAETVPAGDLTYEGSYTVNTYNVYYYVGEELVHIAEVAYGEAIPEYVYEPTEEGYTFLGWVGDTYKTMPAHDVIYNANIDDAINNLMINNRQMIIYDFQGRKVFNTEKLKGGVYVINGRKVVVK